MRILLIQPAKHRVGSAAEAHWSLCRPYSLLYIQAYCEKYSDHEVLLLDIERELISNQQFDYQRSLSEIAPDVIGFTATTFTRHEAREAIFQAREILPAAVIVVGGVHFMNCDVDTIDSISAVDIVVRGEGERIFVELLDALAKRRQLNDIKGITYRNSEGVAVRNPDADLFADLDDVTVYNYKSPFEYPEYYFGSKQKIPATSIMTSRGCPYKCIFCAKSGMQYRYRSTASVIEEIEYYKENFGIRSFNFLDLTFTANTERAEQLCDELIRRKLSMQWWCETRANIPLRLVTKMAAAGCDSFVVGVESGSSNVLKSIQKGVTLEQVESLVQYSLQVGITPICYFMFSHPGETLKDAMETIKFIVRLKKRYSVESTFQPCMIFPGTKIEVLARDSSLIGHKYSWSDEFYDEFNSTMEQATNIPLFVDIMTKNELVHVYQTWVKFRRWACATKRYKKLSKNRVLYAINKYGIGGIISEFQKDISSYLRFIRF
jgi:anaerobic magnesium-protoporphyrin IX monomethyl ester cyclase